MTADLFHFQQLKDLAVAALALERGLAPVSAERPATLGGVEGAVVAGARLWTWGFAEAAHSVGAEVGAGLEIALLASAVPWLLVLRRFQLLRRLLYEAHPDPSTLRVWNNTRGWCSSTFHCRSSISLHRPAATLSSVRCFWFGLAV
jgi:hypothetical protein